MLPGRIIVVVETAAQWATVSTRLHAVAKKEMVLGFDCEWVNQDGYEHRVALLQLAAPDGLCVLLRLNKMEVDFSNCFPQDLKDMLADTSIVKVGVGPHGDAKKLNADYGIFVQSYLDLGWLAVATLGDELSGYNLKSITKQVLNVELNKSWKIRCGDWEADVLSENQVEYAANDALVAVEIFLTLLKRLGPHVTNGQWMSFVKQWLDCPFKQKHRKEKNIKNDPGSTSQFNSNCTYRHQVRQNPLYHNSVLQAPDGQALCVCDIKKANWYLEKHLADTISTDPFVIRLKFEPRGRPTSDEDYYLVEKINACVVCGVPDCYIRKNVVPKEYRRHFPIVMKDHKSHDIVLLCVNCHRRSNMSNIILLRKLAEDYSAPFGNANGLTPENVDRRIKSAAKALTTISHSIPLIRRQQLQTTICNYFGVPEINDRVLAKALSLETNISTEKRGLSHGYNVVSKIASLEGLQDLERIWRQHFLDTMKPEFLPRFWSVNHGHVSPKTTLTENASTITKSEIQ